MTYQIYVLTTLENKEISDILKGMGFIKPKDSGGYFYHSLDENINLALTPISDESHESFRKSKNILQIADFSGNVPSETYIDCYRKIKEKLTDIKYCNWATGEIEEEPEELR
ncbi:MAG: hypothetical protein Q8O89_00720 [Nanoarchaeota archaeon]|nr:hypothetical protein [Nanoarchaeota archaeon]